MTFVLWEMFIDWALVYPSLVLHSRPGKEIVNGKFHSQLLGMRMKNSFPIFGNGNWRPVFPRMVGNGNSWGLGTGFMLLPPELGTKAIATACTLGSGQKGWQLTDGKLIGWQLKALDLATAKVGRLRSWELWKFWSLPDIWSLLDNYHLTLSIPPDFVTNHLIKFWTLFLSILCKAWGSFNVFWKQTTQHVISVIFVAFVILFQISHNQTWWACIVIAHFCWLR